MTYHNWHSAQAAVVGLPVHGVPAVIRRGSRSVFQTLEYSSLGRRPASTVQRWHYDARTPARNRALRCIAASIRGPRRVNLLASLGRGASKPGIKGLRLRLRAHHRLRPAHINVLDDVHELTTQGRVWACE